MRINPCRQKKPKRRCCTRPTITTGKLAIISLMIVSVCGAAAGQDADQTAEDIGMKRSPAREFEVGVSLMPGSRYSKASFGLHVGGRFLKYLYAAADVRTIPPEKVEGITGEWTPNVDTGFMQWHDGVFLPAYLYMVSGGIKYAEDKGLTAIPETAAGKTAYEFIGRIALLLSASLGIGYLDVSHLKATDNLLNGLRIVMRLEAGLAFGMVGISFTVDGVSRTLHTINNSLVILRTIEDDFRYQKQIQKIMSGGLIGPSLSVLLYI
ncbi:MAG: hypothetical protein CMN78_04580 [Spirochaetales bacterium]|nr:hypothetical protein [Spirochaetales bacterium]